MTRFLSDEWLQCLDAAARAATPAPAASPGTPSDGIEIQQVVDAGEGGTIAYRLRFSGPGLRVLPGRSDDPTVTIRQDRATAVAIARGELSAQSAIVAGLLRVSGDVAALAVLQDVLTVYDDAFAAVRAITTY